MIAVLIIPTGVGATIGGHAGDGNPVAKLLASCCDTLITHPNVVNACDINEMPENTWYVEGSILDRFLLGTIGLEPVTTLNKILVVVNRPLTQTTVAAVKAARHTIGIDAEIAELPTPLRMVSEVTSTKAGGQVYGVDELVQSVRGKRFDALAVHTPIEVSRETALHYYRHGGINPWGGVEAIASQQIARALNRPVAHAPLDETEPDDVELFHIHREHVLPQIAAEAISTCYLHCVLKGLHRAPRLVFAGGLSYTSVDVLISPHKCWGTPHKACRAAGIPIVSVRENRIAAPVENLPPHTAVENYLEAAGLLMALRAGVFPQAVQT